MPTSPTIRTCSAVLGAALLLLGLAAAPERAHALPPHLGGMWSSGHDLGNVPVHFVVSPGDSLGMHTLIHWWRSKPEAPGIVYGGHLFWRDPPPALAGAIPSASFPESAFFGRLAESAPINDFCAGTVRLESGLFIIGGTETEAGDVGITQCAILSDGSRTWRADSDLVMHERRWYATGTLLGDGRVFIHSGSKYVDALLYGGVATSPSDPQPHAVAAQLDRAGLTTSGEWDSPGALAGSPSPGVGRPQPREGMSALLSLDGGHAIAFGGWDRDATIPSARGSNEVWWLYRDDNAPGEANSSDYSYSWARQDLGGDPARASGDDKPAGRYRHGAALDAFGDLVVFGGIAAEGDSTRTLGDVWVARGAHYGSADEQHWYRVAIAPADSASGIVDPGPRCGMVMWSDPLLHDVYLFGGARSSDAAPDDPNVYRLSLEWRSDDGPGHYVGHWVIVPPVEGSPSGVPRTRAGSAVDPREYLSAPVPKSMRVLIAGGRTPTGTSGDLVALWLFRTETRTLGVYWQTDPVASGATLPPVLDATVGYDLEDANVFVLGGADSLDRPVATARIAAVPFGSDPRVAPVVSWQPFLGGALPHPRSGACVWIPESDVYPRLAEVFDPYAAPGAPHFTRLDHDPHLAEWYPFDFVIPAHGRAGAHRYVFEAGPRRDSWLVDLGSAAPDGTRWSRVDDSPASSRIKGGTAVMYRIGHILKCGTRDTEIFQPATDRTFTIDLTGLTSGALTRDALANVRWHEETPMHHARVNHSLVVLPTGDVMTFNGSAQTAGNDADDTEFPFVFTPELWHPQDPGGPSPAWTELEPDPFQHRRGYHSSAFLLPDGRIMTGGGNTLHDVTGFDGSANIDSVQIYTPPYLFGADDRLLPRPTILATSAGSADYGQTLTLLTDVPITDIALLRPAATTHAFDEEQRYVPLPRDAEGTATPDPRRFTFHLPSDPDSLPPGDYMLFARAPGMAPSCARWIHVRRSPASPSGDPGDRIAPARIALGLRSCVETDSPALTWRAPADDGTWAPSGPVARYDVRYRTDGPIDSWARFTNATPVPGVPDRPSAPGVLESVPVVMEPGHDYWYAAVSYDDARESANHSAMSAPLYRHAVGCAEELVGEIGTQPDSTLAGGGGAGSDTLFAIANALEDTSARILLAPTRMARRIRLWRAAGAETLLVTIALRSESLLAPRSIRYTERGGRTTAAIAAQAYRLAPSDTLTLDYGAAPATVMTCEVRARRLEARGSEPHESTLPPGLHAIAPQPAHRTAAITFTLTRRGDVSIDVFDAAGRRVRRIAAGGFEAGTHLLHWDGASDRDVRTAPGLYFVRMSSSEGRWQRPLVLLD